MKTMRFLEDLCETIKTNTKIDLYTFKLIVKKFYKTLSDKEKNRWQYIINVITSFTTTQQTIKQNINTRKTKKLETELNNLKSK